jgi:predicted dehydrogenase
VDEAAPEPLLQIIVRPVVADLAATSNQALPDQRALASGLARRLLWRPNHQRCMNSPSRFSRRRFLKSTLLAAPTLAWTAQSRAQIAGANSDVRAAVIGFNGRGSAHIGAFSSLKGARLVALCDADKNVLDRGVQKLSDKLKAPVAGFTDLRKLLEDKSIDVVSIATPNHWHALASIWAVQAGKDVYVEKPVSHNVWEGRKIVEAARKHERIVQTGTQCRSSRAGIAAAVDWVRAGNLGRITLSRGLCYKRRPSIGKVDEPQPIPDGIDYDLWCGPAEKLPLMRKNLHYDWHWVWNTGNGDLGNQGIHQMDICRWFLGENALAPRVLSVGGRLGYIDDGETANTQIIYQAYDKAPLLFEVRGLETDKFMGANVGCIIHCEGGHVLVPNYTEAAAIDKEGKEIQRWKGNVDHFQNFLDAVHSRKHEDLHADILEGHLSSALCHTGNISHRLGAKKSPDEIQEVIRADHGMEETFARMVEHLARNNVDVTQSPVTLGLPLRVDPATEKFLHNDAANKLITRPYRKPFVVPESV